MPQKIRLAAQDETDYPQNFTPEQRLALAMIVQLIRDLDPPTSFDRYPHIVQREAIMFLNEEYLAESELFTLQHLCDVLSLDKSAVKKTLTEKYLVAKEKQRHTYIQKKLS